MMMQFRNNMCFIIDVSWIVLREYALFYTNYSSYKQFIHNLSKNLAKKNILYVKLFQAIALNNNLIDDITNNELLKYTDSVPYDYKDIDLTTIRLLQEKYYIFLEDKNPINSGMVSLVYKATKIDTNTQVVIKIKRKNIEDKLLCATEQFRFLGQILSYIPICRAMNIPFTIQRMIDIMMQQTDFMQEVKNMQEMKVKCKHLDYIKIPNAYEAITKAYSNVILMEYIDGKHITQVDDKDYETFAKQVIKYGFVSSLMGGITHGDLHSGNILFIKYTDSVTQQIVCQIAPIDYGIVVRISENMKLIMLDIAAELTTAHPDTLAEKFIAGLMSPSDLKHIIPAEDYANIVKIFSGIVKDTICTANQAKIYEFFTKLNKYLSKSDLKKFGIRVNDDFAKIQTAIVMANGISMTLCKNKYMEILNVTIQELFHTDLFL